MHSVLAECVLPHVSVVSAFCKAACKDSSGWLWRLAMCIYVGVSRRTVIGSTGCSAGMDAAISAFPLIPFSETFQEEKNELKCVMKDVQQQRVPQIYEQ